MTLEVISRTHEECYSIKNSCVDKTLLNHLPRGKRNLQSAIMEKLKDYCDFIDYDLTTQISNREIGSTPKIFLGKIKNSHGEEINIEIRQEKQIPYPFQPTQLKAKIEYGPNILQEDLDIVRNAFTSFGLEPIN